MVLLMVKGDLCSLFNKNAKDLINDQDTSQDAYNPVTWRRVYFAENTLQACHQAFAPKADKRAQSSG